MKRRSFILGLLSTPNKPKIIVKRIQSMEDVISTIHGLRSGVHVLLGDKIFLLPLIGLVFSALTGFGGFIVFDDLNRKRNRQALGWLLLCGGPILASICLILGLQ